MSDSADEITTLLADARRIARRYYELTGKPLGISGELAEADAARLLGLTLLPARHAAADAKLMRENREHLVQIKGRAVEPKRKYIGRVPSIKLEPAFDLVLLVLIDRSSQETIEIWEADYNAVHGRLSAPGSKARNERNSMGISQFKSIARKVWPVA